MTLETYESRLISDEQIKADIDDTVFEIKKMTEEAMGLRLIGDRISLFKAEAKESGIEKREEFVARLQAILEERKKNLVPN